MLRYSWKLVLFSPPALQHTPRQRLKRGRQKSISPQGSGFQEWRSSPDTLWNEFTLSSTLSWQLSRLRERRGYSSTSEKSGRTGRLFFSRCLPPLPWLSLEFCLTESVHKVVLQKSIPAQICHLILHMGNNKGYVNGFVLELTLAEQIHKHFL